MVEFALKLLHDLRANHPIPERTEKGSALYSACSHGCCFWRTVAISDAAASEGARSDGILSNPQERLNDV